MFKLWLECIGGMDARTHDINTIEAAGPLMDAYADEMLQGGVRGSEVLDGLVYGAPYGPNDIVARVSFNGRVWPRGEAETEKYIEQCLDRNRREGTCTLPPWLDRPWAKSMEATPLHVAFRAQFGGDPLADALLAVEHQLATDSDLDSVTGAAKYQILLQGIRDAMAKKLGFSRYQRG